MNQLVKILKDHSGEPREKELQFWHYVVNYTGSATLCEGEFFGYGESAVEFKTNTVKRGGITCPKCLARIKQMKAIKL